jgi:hypothetical protein
MCRYLVIRTAKYFRPGELCRTSQAAEYYLKLIISVCALKIKYAIMPQSVADPYPHYFRKPELKAGSRSALESKFRSCGAQIEPWRAVDAHNGGLEAQNGALEGPVVALA